MERTQSGKKPVPRDRAVTKGRIEPTLHSPVTWTAITREEEGRESVLNVGGRGLEEEPLNLVAFLP